jgi:IMP dehydrogenase
MGSIEAMKEREGSRERYGQVDVEEDKLIPEGVEGMVPYAGDALEVMKQFIGGLRNSLGYNGCRTIEELRHKARFMMVTHAGFKEGHPHDVTIVKDAPNYRIEHI